MYLTVDSNWKINSIVTSPNDITQRQVNVKSFRYGKMYMDEDLIEDKLCQLIDQ